MKEEITAVVLRAIQEVNEEIGLGSLENPTPDTRLYGEKSGLDSLNLVTIISEVEQQLSEQLGKDVILADERAMSQARSPFRRVSSLVDYIEVLIENEP